MKIMTKKGVLSGPLQNLNNIEVAPQQAIGVVSSKQLLIEFLKSTIGLGIVLKYHILLNVFFKYNYYIFFKIMLTAHE